MKLKRILAGFLAAATALACTGCGESKTSSTPTGNNSGATSSGKTSGGATSGGATSGGATSGGATSGDATSDTTPKKDPYKFEGFDESVKGLKVDTSKIKEGMKLTVLSNRTDRVSGTGNGKFDEWVKPFEDYFKVDVEVTADSNKGTLVQRLNNNPESLADVVWIPVSKDSVNKYFEPLGKVSEMSNYTDITNMAKGDGDDAVVYGVPTGINADGILYNKKIWDKAGITAAPNSPSSFIDALTKIKQSGACDIPILCCYTPAEEWVLSKYMLLAPGSSGDPDFKTKLLVNGGDLFVEGEPYYEMAHMLFQVFSNDDIHEPGAGANWQECKALVAEDKVATVVSGSWAVKQFVEGGLEAGIDAEELKKITLLPPPFTAPDGNQYASIGSDTLWGINKTISDDQKELAKAFVKWWAECSPYAAEEGFIPVLNTATVDEYPESLKSWSGIKFFSNNQDPAGLIDVGDPDNEDDDNSVWDLVNTKSGVLVEEEKAPYLREIAELALAHGSEDDFKAILKKLNTQWATVRDANETLKAFIASPDSEKYKDERFAKKAAF